MEPVVVVVSNHIFSAGDDEVLVVAEPDAVQYNGVEPIHHHPQGVRGKASAPERGTAIDIPHQQAQQHTEDGHGRQFLHIKTDSSRLIAGIHQSQLVATLYNGRRIIEDAFYRVSGHQEHEDREDREGYEGFDEESHIYRYSSKNSLASATQSGQSRRTFPVPTPLSNRHWVAPLRCWNFSIISFIRARDWMRSFVARPTIMPAPTRAPQVPSILPMPVP